VKVYLSVDMEGIAGVSHPGPTDPKHDRYPTAVELMIGETNAAIEGAFTAGATDVLVNDSHGEMYNLLPDRVHPAARLLQGQKPWSMVQGAGPDAGFVVALFVGYHARAGHPTGTIAHTYSSAPVETRLDGRPTGEYGLNALALAAWDVPVGLVAGDDALAEEVAEWLPWAERVVVKRAVSWQAADAFHPAKARELVREGAQRAVERAATRSRSLEPLRLDPPIEVGIDFRHGGQADLAAFMPGFRREGDRGVRYAAADGVDAYRAFVSAVRMATLADD
jgi:D-amino peptidase